MGAARAMSPSCTDRSARRASACRMRHARRRHELPRRRACKLAVTQSRGLGQAARASTCAHAGADRPGAAARHQDQRLPERLRPASHRRRSAFRAACGSSAARAVPQYFVMSAAASTRRAPLRPAGGQGAGPADARRPGPADRDCTRRSERRGKPPRLSSAALESARVKGAARRPRGAGRRGLPRPATIVDLAEEAEFTVGDAGRRVHSVMSEGVVEAPSDPPIAQHSQRSNAAPPHAGGRSSLESTRFRGGFGWYDPQHRHSGLDDLSSALVSRPTRVGFLLDRRWRAE